MEFNAFTSIFVPTYASVKKVKFKKTSRSKKKHLVFLLIVSKECETDHHCNITSKLLKVMYKTLSNDVPVYKSS